MNNKYLGILLLIIGIILISNIQINKANNDKIIGEIVSEQGSCFLEDGICLHEDRSTIGYLTGTVLGAVIIALGIFLIFFEKSQKEIVNALNAQKQIRIDEEKFDILLKGLTEEEKRIIKAVKEQDGITQQTLRLRTDLHKSKLSIVLDGLEKKGLVVRKEKGKTKQVFLKIAL